MKMKGYILLMISKDMIYQANWRRLSAETFFSTELESYITLNKVALQGDIKIYLFILLHGDIWRMGDNFSVYRLVNEDNGNSWTSRMRSDEKRFFKQWKGLRNLEKVVKEAYGVKINCKQRKQQFAFYDFLMNRTIFRMIGKGTYYSFNQSGMFFIFLKKVFKDRKGKILKNKK